jgi:hypothetical protein
MNTCSNIKPLPSSRREFLRSTGMGLGAIAASTMFNENAHAVAPQGKAKRILHIFLQGASTHLDMWDYKPELEKFDGKKINGNRLGHATDFEFTPCGQSGLLMSSCFPQLQKHADDICVVRSMMTDVPAHDVGVRMFNTGQISLPRPSFGSWVSYGLGLANDNLPGFVSLAPGGAQRYTESMQSAFLPGLYQGTPIDTRLRDVNQMIANIKTSGTLQEQRRKLDLLAKMNTMHSQLNAKDIELENRIKSYEIAYNMQIEATEAFDVSKEEKKVRDTYGNTDTGKQFLIARRLLERGVRFVQAWNGGWDMHDNLFTSLTVRAKGIDGPLTALIDDLKQRGMLHDTLIILGGEFGRTPHRDGAGRNGYFGRAHQHTGFSTALIGGGVKGGTAYGATDELGYKAVENPCHVHDLHATVLTLLGFDFKEFTYRYNGRDFRLTDVHGEVQKGIIA